MKTFAFTAIAAVVISTLAAPAFADNMSRQGKLVGAVGCTGSLTGVTGSQGGIIRQGKMILVSGGQGGCN